MPPQVGGAAGGWAVDWAWWLGVARLERGLGWALLRFDAGTQQRKRIKAAV